MLDEPTCFLDIEHEVLFYQVLSRVKKDLGRTLVVVSHDINRSLSFSDKILALKEGKIFYWGDAQELYESSKLGQLYNTKFKIVSSGDESFVVPEVANR